MYLKVSGQTRSTCQFNFIIFFYLLGVTFNRMCGPRTFQDSKFDSRSFGFPFDRELAFPLSKDHVYK